MSHRGSVSEKGEAKRTYEVVCQLWKRDAVATPTLHSVISPPRVRLLVCGACCPNNRKEIVFEVLRPLSMWKKTTRGFALPTLERKVVDVATVSRS